MNFLIVSCHKNSLTLVILKKRAVINKLVGEFFSPGKEGYSNKRVNPSKK